MPFKFIQTILSSIPAVALVLAMLLIAGSPVAAQSLPDNGVVTDGVIVKQIVIEGNHRADEETIRFYLKNAVGEPFSADNVKQEVAAIYKLKFFDDIRVLAKVDPDGLTVTYSLREKPFIRKVELVGMEDSAKKKVQPQLKSRVGMFYQRELVAQDAETVRAHYRNQGFFFTQVDANVKDVENNQVDITFTVDEHNKLVIGSINITGNHTYPDDDILGAMETKVWTVAAYMMEQGTYKRDTLKTDLLRIESFYHDRGFIKVRVGEPRVEIDRDANLIRISIDLVEGEKYFIGKVEAEGDKIYSSEELMSHIQLKTGEPFSRAKFRENLFSITDLYAQKGYAFADVIPITNIHEDTRTVDLRIRTDYGRKMYIGQIDITGNTRTRDNVIRRELRFSEGELFDSVRLRRSNERVNNLGFFDKVEINQQSGSSDDMLDVDVKVTERSTASFSAGAGYSSLEHLILQAQITDQNFLGYGQSVTLSTQQSSLKNDVNFQFTEPRLFNRELSVTVSGFNQETDWFSYKSRNTGGSLALGRSFGEYLWGRIGYKNERVNVYLRTSEDPGPAVTSQLGKTTTGAFFTNWTRDTRDDVFSPSHGLRTQLYGELAARAFLGSQQFYKGTFEQSVYFPLYLGFIGMLHGKIGYTQAYGDSVLPIYENFFLGGANTLRGFTFNQVGPRDTLGQSIGGPADLLFNVELHYPFTRYVRGIIFYDRGQVYGTQGDLSVTTDKFYDIKNMRSSYGFGIKFFSPIGPISLAWGYKLDPLPGESTTEFHFTIGQSF